MGLSLVTAPASEPITAAEVKTHMRVDISDDDTYIEKCIADARQHFESVTRRALVEQTWDYTLHEFPSATKKWPSGAIVLPIQPVTSVTSVTYVDSAGATQTFTYGTSPDTPKYDVITDGPRTVVIPKYNLDWPATRDHGNAVTVRFVAGYATLPYDIRRCLYFLVAHFYENRENIALGAGVMVNPIPLTAETLMSSYILRGF